MRITESQLRKIIIEEIEEMLEDDKTALSSGEKKAEKAIDATSISSHDANASGINNSDGLKDLILSTIKKTALGKNKNLSAIKTALKDTFDTLKNESKV